MRLVATHGDQSLDFPLRQGSMLIGRHPSCHVCIPARGISRRHCQLYIDGANSVLRDLGSANGTYVNSRRVEDRVDLHDGDVIALGDFRLRFDLHEAAAPQPHPAEPAAAAADSGVIDVTPVAQGYPQQPGQPFPTDEPPAPSDFPENPQPDDTPVDADFVPPAYDPGAAPAQSTALAVSAGVPMQPQLIVRDGRWYLRDPRSGREVEISPKDPSAATAVVRPEGAAPARRPNTRLLIAAIAGVAILVAFAAVVLRTDQRGPDPDTITRKDYYRHVDKALKAIIAEQNKPKDQATETPKALERLDRVHGLLPDVGVAAKLAGYIRLMQTLPDFEDDPKKFPWPQAKNPLESIMEAGTPSDTVNSYAERQLHRVEILLGVIARFDELLRKKDAATIEEKIEVWRKLGQLPPDTIVSKKAEAEEEKLRVEITKHYRDKAKAAQGQKNWPDAVLSYREALRYATDAEKAAIQKQIATCQEDERDSRTMEQAQAAFRDDDLDGAEAAAGRVPDGSRFRPQADALVQRIQDRRQREAREQLDQRVLARFKAGDGPGAMEIAVQGGAGDKYKYLERQYKEVERLMALGKKSEDEQKYAKAHEHYTAASQVIADAENAYTTRANDALDHLKDRHEEIAEEFARQADRLIYTDPIKAREIFNKALGKFDPTNKRAKKGLDTLHRVASDLHTRASELIRKGELLQALEMLKKGLTFADPGGGLAVVIKRKIDEIEK